MTWTNLGYPSPRSEPVHYTPIRWPVSRVIALTQDEPSVSPSFFRVLATRRSERNLGNVSLDQLGVLLWQVARCQGVAASSLGFDLEQRPYPSAGAIHPIHLMFYLRDEAQWYRYNARLHQLEEIPDAKVALAPLITQCKEVVDVDSGIIVLFVAEPAMTQAKYHDHASLVWRDAGVVQNTLALGASALGMNACLLGITGDPWAGALSDQGELVGVGVALIGTST